MRACECATTPPCSGVHDDAVFLVFFEAAQVLDREGLGTPLPISASPLGVDMALDGVE